MKLRTAFVAVTLITGMGIMPPAAAQSTANPAAAETVAAGNGRPDDSNLQYYGRWNKSNASWYSMGWAGGYVETGFTGSSIGVRQRNTIDLYYSIDHKPPQWRRNVSGTVTLATGLSGTSHTIRIGYRERAGSYTGDPVFGGLVLAGGAQTVPISRPPKLVEFIGDSITVGQPNANRPFTAYPWLTGEALKAGHTQVAQGGACLVSQDCYGMMDWFRRSSAWVSTDDWNFSTYQASAVVINLGTNDVGHGVSTTKFQQSYVVMLERVRRAYPSAQIFAMGTFRNRYVPETRNAVAARTAAGDGRVHFVDTTGWINPATDTSDNVHPTEAGHVKISQRLTPILAGYLQFDQTGCSSPTATAAAPSAQAPVTVWMAGDSTMAAPSAGATCPVGWGSQFAQYFNANVTVKNSAVAGRSIQTWLYDPNVTTRMNSAGECVVSPATYSSRWRAMLDATNGMKAGDYLVIQFGINDGDRNCPRHVGSARYRELLGVMASAAKARGVHPILLTPVAAITCSGSTAVGNRGFISETNSAASANQVPVVDLHRLSYTLYNTLHFCPNNGDYRSGPVGAFFCNDHTHFEAAGARQIAGVVAKALRDQQIPLSAYLK
ncbi:lysophospholipase L1-like esterase [Kribbella voronezhensis]|uniref:Lysophospholipase L1-like esterase n=1 Tax=Kribbella voronezhensis TaxID=2512212 RepID=A0A4R7T9R6_9ACTN|nr:GDSL-type esterase/lipase family protein [Kribbella voronezhensis]TDU87978.1 lysophospholipase L1-like esterase [Kribbella voronezhensis]